MGISQLEELEYQKFYNGLKKEISNLERQEVLFGAIFLTSMLFLPFVFVLYLFYSLFCFYIDGYSFIFLLFLTFFGVLFSVFLSVFSVFIARPFLEKIGSKHQREFVKNITVPLVNTYFSQFSYSFEKGIEKNNIFESNFFSFSDYKNINFESKHHFEGVIGRTHLEFSWLFFEDVSLRKVKNLDSVIFKGMFFKIDFNKHFSGKTLVLPRESKYTLDQRINKFFQSLVSGSAKRIHLESQNFDERYVVYSSDRLEARYILSLNFMDNILDLEKECLALHKTDSPMFSFVNQNFYLAIPMERDVFGSTVGKSPLDVEDFTIKKSVMDFFAKIPEILELEKRIWTKK